MNTSIKKKPRVTIKDVASAAGVSIATVSYVLNNTPGQSIGEETRKKVLQFANILGYECNVMARFLATGRTNTVAVVLKDSDGFAGQYYIKMITELSRLLSQQNLTLKLIDYAYETEHPSDACAAYITVALSEKEFRAFADTKYAPVIAVDSRFVDFLFYRINDNYRLMYDTAKQELGVNKISLLTFELSDECMKAAKEVFDNVIIVRGLQDLSPPDDYGYVTTSKALHRLVARPAYLHSASYALKASAAADSVIKAINRVQSSTEEHDILV